MKCGAVGLGSISFLLLKKKEKKLKEKSTTKDYWVKRICDRSNLTMTMKGKKDFFFSPPSLLLLKD